MNNAQLLRNAVISFCNEIGKLSYACTALWNIVSDLDCLHRKSYVLLNMAISARNKI